MNYNYADKSPEVKFITQDKQIDLERSKAKQATDNSKIPTLNKHITKNQTFQSNKSLSDSDFTTKTPNTNKSINFQSIFNKNYPNKEISDNNLKKDNGINKESFLVNQKMNMQKEREQIEKKIDNIIKKLDESEDKGLSLSELTKLGKQLEKEESKLNKLESDFINLDKKLGTIKTLSADQVDQTKAELKDFIANVRMVTISDGKAEASRINDADYENKKLSDLISFNPDIGTVKVTKDRENEFKGLIGTTMRFEIAPQQFKEVTITKVETFKKEELVAISRGLYIYQNQNQDNSKLEEDAKKNKNLQSTPTQQPAARSETNEVNKNVNDKQQANATVDVKLKSTQGEKDSPVKQLEKYFEASLKKFEKIEQSVEKHELFLENKKTDYESHELRKEIRNELNVRIFTLLKEINHRKVVLPPETSTRLRILSSRLVELDSIPKDKINMDNSKELASLKKEMVQLLEETTTTTGKMDSTSRGTEGKPTSPA